MLRGVCVPVALMSCLVLLLPADTHACPRSCNCYQTSEVHCTFRALLTVPPGLPLHARRINLGFNSINAIHNKSLAGLKKLELLMLHSNDLHHLPDAVFADLKSVQILKLSYNKLREIPSSLTFSGLTSLLRLYLDHNLLQHIHPRALLQLPSLRLLRLQGNRLHQLHPHALCTLSLLNTYHFSTLRHLDLSNNSLTTLPRKTLATAPLLETLLLQDNPWSCDCRMNWFLSLILAHPGLMKCPGDPQCPVCASPNSLKSQALLEQNDLTCTSPVIPSAGRETPLEAEISELESSESFKEPLGSAALDLSDHQGNKVDLRCNITQSSEIQDHSPPDFSMASPAPLPLALSLTLDCPVDRQGYEKLWRILAYYSETAVRLERETMLSKAPSLAYRYRQAAETDGYYHSGVRASVKARPLWLLQPAISIQLNRAQSNGHKVQLIYSTRVSARLDLTYSSTSSPISQPWVLISTNNTITSFAAAAGHTVELQCPLMSSGNPKVQWILPDGSQHSPTYRSSDSRLQISTSSLVLHKVELSDAGIYYCIARAGRDVDVLPLRLTVEESSVPPSGEPIGLSVTSAVGDPVTLSCKASGSPEPQKSWLLPDGNIVRQGVAASGGVTLHPNGSLLLPNPSRRDAGYYRCIAVSQYGSDAVSTKLQLHSKRPPLLKMHFPRGPQSAAGRSTKIRAPLLHEVGEGSGDEEEEADQTLSGKKRQRRPLQPFPNRRYPAGNLRRRGPMIGPPRRGQLSSTDQRRNHVQNRLRVTTNKQRIDPQKWADLLAKIRQKTEHTSNNQTNQTEKSQTEANSGNPHNDTERDEGTGVVMESETEEGSSADVTDLQEEDLQPIYPVFTERKTHSTAKTDAGTDSEINNGVAKSTAMPTDTENSRETHIQMENVDPQTEILRNPDSRKEVTSQTISAMNTNTPEPNEGGEQKSDPTNRPHKNRQSLLPNLVPNSRPQSPWNSRRRIGQRRRIIHRPGLRPLRPPQRHPHLSNPKSPTETSKASTEQTNWLPLPSTTSSPASLLTQNSHSGNVVEHNSFHAPFSYTGSVSTSKSDSPLETSSPSSLTSVSPTHAGRVTLPTKISEPTDFTQAPSWFDNTIAVTDVSDTSAKTHKHDTEKDTETQAVSGTPREQLERNSLKTPFVPHSSTFSSTTPTSISPSTGPIPATTVVATEKTTTSVTTQDTPLSSTSITEMLWTTTAASVTSSPILPSIMVVKQVTYSTTRMPTTTVPADAPTTPSLSSTTVTPSTRAMITTAAPTSPTVTTSNPTTTTTAAFTSPTVTTSTPTATTTTAAFTSPTVTPSTPTTTTTTAAFTSPTLTPSTPTTTTAVAPTSPTVTPSTPTTTTAVAPTSPTVTPSTPAMTTSAATTAPTTHTRSTAPRSTSATTSAPSASITTPIKTLSRGRTNVDQGWRPASGVSNQSRFSTDWKNPGANSIPDSHSSRPRWRPSPPLPAAPGAPVLRSKPKIAEPRVRTASFPAESTARLVCETEGEPKPFITWTKVATGAVMSIHSRPQRYEVLSNGTLVIRDVQLQDRGTYICSAYSFLGRDRSITTLDVWTRPPRMLVPSYRETTIHQGGELHLECHAEGVPTPLHSWVLADRSVLTSTASSQGRITMDANATLHISAILPSDRGLYRCVASNSAGAASATVRIYVSSLPPVMQLPKEEHLLLSPGMPVYAHCSARGAPPPTLRWRIPNGTLVRPSQFLHDNLFVLPNGTLHIRKVGPKDFGNYECTASNAVGADKRTVRVKIDRSAESEIRQGSGTVDKSSSSPSLHNERNVSSSSRSSNPISSNRLSSLLPIVGTPGSPRTFSYPRQHNSTDSIATLSKTATVTDSPLHLSNTRPANNTDNSPSNVNTTRKASSLPSDKRKVSTVLHPLPVSPFTKARIVSTSPSLSTVHYGRDLQLRCSVTGNPPPIVIWRTPSKKLVDVHFSFDKRLKVHSDGTLSVQAVTDKDAGDYLCITRNKVADDYRLLRVSVATKPAKIEPRQPLNHMVSLGKTLKVDCQASGLPDPAVHWKLPDGTMVNSVLQAEEQGGRARRLTVFDNGTLLVPAVGAREEGEYTCYAENQGGQDTMKVKVKVMMATPPAFSDGRSFYVVKVPQGKTAVIRCQAKGDPTPIITWFSPVQRAIPHRSRFYHERVAVLLGGSLEVYRAQKLDAGNYTCRASNSAGETNMVVGLEVEAPNYGPNNHVGGRGWSPNVVPGIAYSGVSRHSNNNGGISRDGISNGVTGQSGSSNNDRSDNSGRIGNNVPRKSTYTANDGFNPNFRSAGQNRFSQPGSGITAHLGSTVISFGLGRTNDVQNQNQAGINPNGPGIVSSGTHNSETISGISGTFSSALSNLGGASGTAETNGSHRKTSSTTGTIQNKQIKNSTNSTVGVVTLKKKALKGQTVLLPCPSVGSPPPRVAWLLPSNGVLPAPYYGSRFVVHRNGSLELRGVRVSDTGTLTCVVRGTRDETKIQVELEVSESPNEVRSPQSRAVGRPVPESPSLSQSPQSTLSSVSPEKLHSKAPITQTPLKRGSPAAPFTLAPPPRLSVPLPEPVIKSRTVPLVSITNGETLHLTCSVPQTHGHTQGSLSWALPSGSVISLGESGDSGRYNVQEDGTLTVRHTTVFDRGTYTCKSTSYDSSLVSAITVPVIIIAYPPRITMGPSPLTYTRAGVTVELPCLTIATPRATITWETPDLTRIRVMGQAHLYGNRYLRPQGSLVIQNPTSRDSGVYKCTASNVIGADTKVTYLHVL